MKKIKFIKNLLLCMLMITLTCFNFVACSSNSKKNAAEKNSVNASLENDNGTEATENLPVATISVENYGDVEVELYPEIAPNTVNNFISLSNSGFYDKLTFHRVIKDFMIQGGDPNGDGTGGPGYSIEGEFTSNGFANSLKHTEGVISMARSQNPDSAGSQFFIMTSTSQNLDGKYASFGKVISGMNIIKELEKVDTDSNDKPKKDVIIDSIRVDTKGVDYQEPDKKK